MYCELQWQRIWPMWGKAACHRETASCQAGVKLIIETSGSSTYCGCFGDVSVWEPRHYWDREWHPEILWPFPPRLTVNFLFLHLFEVFVVYGFHGEIKIQLVEAGSLYLGSPKTNIVSLSDSHLYKHNHLSWFWLSSETETLCILFFLHFLQANSRLGYNRLNHLSPDLKQYIGPPGLYIL